LINSGRLTLLPGCGKSGSGHTRKDPRTVRLRIFPVTAEPDARLVEGPYVAETFPVTVEDEYVVVEM
jgi:3-phenylpropionate/trans-cinnamate dioxygenase ferredoxin subunit